MGVDYGQPRRNGLFVSQMQKVRDENGDFRGFYSMMDALNWLSTKGWEFVQTYTVSDDGDDTVYWLLRRNVTGLTEEEKSDILSLFQTNR